MLLSAPDRAPLDGNGSSRLQAAAWSKQAAELQAELEHSTQHLSQQAHGKDATVVSLQSQLQQQQRKVGRYVTTHCTRALPHTQCTLIASRLVQVYSIDVTDQQGFAVWLALQLEQREAELRDLQDAHGRQEAQLLRQVSNLKQQLADQAARAAEQEEGLRQQLEAARQQADTVRRQLESARQQVSQLRVGRGCPERLLTLR